jgi:hypothetical protein
MKLEQEELDLVTDRELTQQAPINDQMHEELAQRIAMMMEGLRRGKDGELTDEEIRLFTEQFNELVLEKSPKSVIERAIELDMEESSDE